MTGNALLNLRHAPLHLRPGKVLVSVVYRLELAAIDRDAHLPKQAHSSAKKDEPGAHLTNRPAIVLAEVGNRLVVRNKATRQPHHLDVASSLALEPPAGLNPIEVAVDIELQQDRWMVRGPASYFGSNPVKSQLRQIKLINKDIDHLDRIILVDPVFQTLGKQRALLAIRALNEALHLILQQPNQLLRESHEARRFHTTWVIRVGLIRRRRSRHVRFAPQSGHRELVSTMSVKCQSRPNAPQQATSLFDDLVGAREHCIRHLDAERLGG